MGEIERTEARGDHDRRNKQHSPDQEALVELHRADAPGMASLLRTLPDKLVVNVAGDAGCGGEPVLGDGHRQVVRGSSCATCAAQKDGWDEGGRKAANRPKSRGARSGGIPVDGPTSRALLGLRLPRPERVQSSPPASDPELFPALLSRRPAATRPLPSPQVTIQGQARYPWPSSTAVFIWGSESLPFSPYTITCIAQDHTIRAYLVQR